jgi:large subunit ribosomal protein L6
MSRIGKLPITAPTGVDVSVTDSSIEVKGPLGTLNFTYRADAVNVSVIDGNITVEKVGDTKLANALWGTTRACINNMVEGVTKGYKKGLEIN